MTPRAIPNDSGYQVYRRALILLERVYVVSAYTGCLSESNGVAKIHGFELQVTYAEI